MELPTQNGKRLRDDSDPNSPLPKIARVDSFSEHVNSQLVRSDSDDPAMDSSLPRDIKNDLFNILDEADSLTERDTTMQGLDSVIKSFEEEILASGLDPTPESRGFHVELGYLLEASDDELGLPPSATETEETRPASEDFTQVGSDGVDMGGLLGFENGMENYGLVGLGSGENENGGGVVSFDGLLDYPESYESVWRSESLQAM